MARTIEQIKQEITSSFMGNEDVKRIYGLRGTVFENEFSKVSLESLIFYVVAVAIWSLEKLFDIFTQEQETALKALHPHTLYWYADKAKAYQHGYALPPFEDVYDNTGVSESDIIASKIVTYASASQYNENGSSFIRIKVAKGGNGNLAPLDQNLELVPFTAYIEQIRDAGVILICTSNNADTMQLTATVLVDPKLFYDNGESILQQGSFPIKVAFEEYLQNLPFDGIYSKTAHMDYVQKVKGVITVSIDSIECVYGNNVSSIKVVDGFKPDSGWIKFENSSDLVINYKTKL